MDVERMEGEWIAFYPGNDGKRLRASDLVIPSELDESQVVTWIADWFHESATEKTSIIEILE
jgi:hypothetical protein